MLVRFFINALVRSFINALPLMVSSTLEPSASFVTFMLQICFSILTLLLVVEHSCWLGINVSMEQIRFNYSLKNIGLPTHDAYRINIIDKTEHESNECAGKLTSSYTVTPATKIRALSV